MRNKLYLTFILVGIYILLSFNSFAAKVFGVVRDEKNEPLIGAVVVLKGLEKGTQTDIDGKYEFDNVEDGTYEIVFSMVTYKKVLKTITVLKGKDVEMDAVLKEEGNNKLTEVTVKSTKTTNTENAVLMEMRKSNAVVSGISAQQIAKTMDRNAAEVVKRVPGVTIMEDKFIMVRGLNDRYNSVWLNDVGAPSSEVDKKAFSFDMIPSGQIDRIMVYKTPSPELPGDFAGGMVKIYTTSIPAKNSYNVGFQLSSREYTTGTDFNYNKRSKTDWLGFDDGMRNLPEAVQKSEFVKRNDPDNNEMTKSFGNNWQIFTKKQTPDIRANIAAANIFSIKKVRIGNTFSGSYSNTATNYENKRYDWDSVTNNNDYTDKQSVNNINTALMDNIAVAWGNNKIELKNLYNQLSRASVTVRNALPDSNRGNQRSYVMSYESRAVYSTQLTGSHKSRDDSRRYTWSLGYTDMFRNLPDLRRISYYKQIDQSDSFYKAGVPVGAPDVNNGGGRVYSQLFEKTYAFSHQYTQKIKIGDYEFEGSIGNYIEQKGRAYNLRQFGYTIASSTPFLEKNRLLTTGINDIFADSNVGAKNRFRIEENTLSTDKYDAKNQLIASFVSFKLPAFYNKMTIYGGVRHEYNTYKLISQDQAKNFLAPVIKTNFFLPSINVSYAITDKQLVRVAYGKTLNRPEFRENAPFFFYDMENRWGIYGAMAPTLINPSSNGDTLDVAKIHNVDARWEWYPSSSELIQAGVFYKKILNPIQTVINNPTGDSRSFTFANMKEAYSAGVEVDIRKNLVFIDGLVGTNIFKDFQFIGNAAWIKSRVFADTSKGDLSDMPLQGQSPYTYNAGLYYQSDSLGLSATLVYNVYGPRIFAIGIPNMKVGSIYEMPFNSMDLIITKRLMKYVTLSFGVQNLLNQKNRQYIDVDYGNTVKANYQNDASQSDRPSNLFRPGRYFTFGIKCKL